MKNYIKDRFTTYADDETILHELFDKCYVLAILPRSGSTWIGNVIDKNNLGWPNEWINETAFSYHCDIFKEKNLKKYLYKLINEKKRENIWAIQLTYWHIFMFCQALPLNELLGPHPEWLYLRRKDILSQGISLYRSVVSGYWHSYHSDHLKAEYEKVEYDSEQIKHWVHHILVQENKFEEYFEQNAINPKRYYFEDLKNDPTNLLIDVADILEKNTTTFTYESDFKRVSKKNVATEWKERFINDENEFMKRLDARPAFY